jgi:hypothetical protein
VLIEFHEDLSGKRHHGMHVTDRRNRPGEVRHDSDFVQIAERHNLQHFGDAADVRQRCSRKVDIPLFDQRTEFLPACPILLRVPAALSSSGEVSVSVCGTVPRAPDLRRRTAASARSNCKLQPPRENRNSGADQSSIAIRADTFSNLCGRFADFTHSRARVECTAAASHSHGYGCVVGAARATDHGHRLADPLFGTTSGRDRAVHAVRHDSRQPLWLLRVP